MEEILLEYVGHFLSTLRLKAAWKMSATITFAGKHWLWVGQMLVAISDITMLKYFDGIHPFGNFVGPQTCMNGVGSKIHCPGFKICLIWLTVQKILYKSVIYLFRWFMVSRVNAANLSHNNLVLSLLYQMDVRKTAYA